MAPVFPLGRRGERPLTLPMDPPSAHRLRELVPGVKVAGRGIVFAWDAVPALLRLGVNLGNLEPDLTGLDLAGAAEYQAAFKAKLRPYQREMVEFLVTRSYAINADPMRCLAGKTLLTVKWADGSTEQVGLGKLYEMQRANRRGFSLRSIYESPSGPKFVWNDCTIMHSTGMRRCLRAVFVGSQGYVLTATPEHKVLTRQGMRELQTLRPGDEVLAMGGGTQPVWRKLRYLDESTEGLVSTFDLTMQNPFNNYVANGMVVSNSGKTPTTLAAASLVGCQKVLVVCPSIAKLVWATEINKWLGQPSLLLYGRGGDEAKSFCASCNGTGRADGKHCSMCKAKNGQGYGYRIFRDGDVRAALDEHRFVVTNYDILIPQVQLSAAGVRSEREDLPGWVNLLKTQPFDLVIADEAHILRGRAKRDRAGQSRRDKLIQAAQGAPRFWALTGTPIYGRVSDLWAMLDVVTDGLFGRPFFSFDVRYADGRKGTYGWENDGMTNPEELKARLDTFMLKRDRAEILPHLPPKTRQVVRLDAGKAEFKQPKGKRTVGGLHGALRTTAKIKEKPVTEAVVAECAEGAKVVVFSYLRDNGEALAKAIATEAQDDPRLKLRNMRVWCVSGDTPVEARFKQAQMFREWEGAGAFVATIDSVPVAISLKGAQSVHFADLTFDPASLLQAEDRPYEVGTSGLTIIYYVVEKTVDEHVVQLVLPKMSTLESMVKEKAAGDFRAAFGGVPDLDALAEDIWKRMEEAAG